MSLQALKDPKIRRTSQYK